MKTTLINIDRIERIEIHINEFQHNFLYDSEKKQVYTKEYKGFRDDYPTKEYYDDFKFKENHLYLKDDILYVLPYVILKFSNDSIKEYFNNEEELNNFLKELETNYNFKPYNISACNEVMK